MMDGKCILVNCDNEQLVVPDIRVLLSHHISDAELIKPSCSTLNQSNNAMCVFRDSTSANSGLCSRSPALTLFEDGAVAGSAAHGRDSKALRSIRAARRPQVEDLTISSKLTKSRKKNSSPRKRKGLVRNIVANDKISQRRQFKSKKREADGCRVSQTSVPTSTKHRAEKSRVFAHGTSWRRICVLDPTCNIFGGRAFRSLEEKPLLSYGNTIYDKRKIDKIVSRALSSQPAIGEHVALIYSALGKCRQRKAEFILATNRFYVQNLLCTVWRYTNDMKKSIPTFAKSKLNISNAEYGLTLHHRSQVFYNFKSEGKKKTKIIKYKLCPCSGDTCDKLVSHIIPATLTHLHFVTPHCKSTVWIGMKGNHREDDDSVLRYVPYFGDHDAGDAIDASHYTNAAAVSDDTVCSLNDEVVDNLLRLVLPRYGLSKHVFNVLEKICAVQNLHARFNELQHRDAILDGTYKRAANMISDSVEAARCSAKASVSDTFTSWRYTHSNRKQKAMLDVVEYKSLMESFRDLFCRLCYTYDCFTHGIEHPLPDKRCDPVYPKLVGSQQIRDRGIAKLFGVGHRKPNDIRNDDIRAHQRKRKKCHSINGAAANVVQEEQNIRMCESNRAMARVSKCTVDQSVCHNVENGKEDNGKQPCASTAPYLDFINAEVHKKSYLMSHMDNFCSGWVICGSHCCKRHQKKLCRTLEQPHALEVIGTNFSSVDLLLIKKLRLTVGDIPCLIARILQSVPCCTVAALIEQDEKCAKKNAGNDSTSTTNSIRSTSNNGRSNVGFHRKSLMRDRMRRIEKENKNFQYEPCDHSGDCSGSNCSCLDRHHTCERACSCPRECPNRFVSYPYYQEKLSNACCRFQGCRCAFGKCRTKSCPCFVAARECNPDLCQTCGASELPIIKYYLDKNVMLKSSLQDICRNVNIQRASEKKICVSFSKTHGWGAFAMEPIRRGDFICEYIGAMISQDEAERRGTVYDKHSMSFLFNLNDDSVIDAIRRGNKSKFINHGACNQNCKAKIVRVGASHHIAIFARVDITVGEELYFDYGYQGQSAPDWS